MFVLQILYMAMRMTALKYLHMNILVIKFVVFDFEFIHNHKMTYACTKRAGRFFIISSMRAYL